MLPPPALACVIVLASSCKAQGPGPDPLGAMLADGTTCLWSPLSCGCRAPGRVQLDSVSAWKRKQAKQRILGRVTNAYGHMLLVDGLFQADAHPGNILVQPGAP